MKTPWLLVVLLIAVVASGCAKRAKSPAPIGPGYVDADPPAIATSLFPSDQAVLGDEAVARILAGKVELPAAAKLALLRFPDAASQRYWRDEATVKLQQSQVELLSKALRGSGRITEVTPLPSLMTPRQLSIPSLREAAVRLQAHLLLVFRIGSDTYSQYRAFAKDKVKSYSSCEVVLLDVRTGLVPFARVVNRERVEVKLATDMDTEETRRRAEQGASAEALNAAAEELATFLKGL